MSAACGVLVLGRSSANGSLGRWWRGSRASEGRDRSHVHAGGTRAWRNVCSAVGRGGGEGRVPMVFARSLQPARALPMYVPLCRPRKTARCSGRGRTTPARSALAGWRKPTAAGAGRSAQGMCSGVWSEARGCERRGAMIGSSAGGA